MIQTHNFTTTTIQLETTLCYQHCFCNTESRTATEKYIKGLLIQTQQNTFVSFILMRNRSQQFPQTSACFGQVENQQEAFMQKRHLA